jgi:hypothetical protein
MALLLGVPTILAILIYKFNPLISESNWGLVIIIALWWLLVFGWLNYYQKKEQLRQFAIQITQLPKGELEEMVKQVDIQLEGISKQTELEEDIYPRADLLIKNVNQSSRYRIRIWY